MSKSESLLLPTIAYSCYNVWGRTCKFCNFLNRIKFIYIENSGKSSTKYTHITGEGEMGVSGHYIQRENKITFLGKGMKPDF